MKTRVFPGSPMTRLRRRADREDGFTLIELTAALSILTVGFFALAGALGIGFRQIALGRQRQTAAEVGNARIEHLRNVPFAAVALNAAVIHETDPEHPDFFVSLDGTQFDVSGQGNYEDLIVDDVAGQVPHLEDPVTVGQTLMEVFQYVTWADQANNVKRLTVVTRYKVPAVSAVSRVVRVSSFFTPGTVTVTGSGTSPSQGSAPPTSDPIPTPGNVCLGDTTGPTGSFSIASQTGSEIGYTPSTTVSIFLSLSDPCTPITAKFSNDGVTYSQDFTYDPNNPAVSWTIPSGDGTKNVWGQARDGVSNLRTFGPETIVLDTVSPTVPGVASRTVSCVGNDRTVTVSWGSSTDLHLNGYRIYRSINAGPFEVLAQTTTNSATDTHDKKLDSVRYYAVGYDKAGNESDATNTISLSKNQCS